MKKLVCHPRTRRSSSEAALRSIDPWILSAIKKIPAFAGMTLLFVAFAPFTAHAGDNELVPSIAVIGFAEVKLAPDQAVINVNAYTENKELAAAKKEQDAKVKKLLAIALKNGAKKDDIRTQRANVQPLYDYVQATKKRRFRAHSLTNSIEIKLGDLDKVGPLMDALVAADFDRIQGVRFELKNRRGHQDYLLKQALKNAKQKAEMMADALGSDIGRPLTVTESGAHTPPPVYRSRGKAEGMMAMAADSGSMESYSPTGMVQIQQTVNVTFELE